MPQPDPIEPTATSPLEDGQRTVKEASIPDRIGRYRVQGLLGKGGFGIVYQALDEQLGRQVAIKVPHAEWIAQADDLAAYLEEARIVAQLDHPHIVPVHDVGSTKEMPCFIVSKYVEGMNLAARLRDGRQDYLDIARLIATLADAVHHAHKAGLVHRDIKPSNILVGTDGRAYVVDFGLALRENDVGSGPRHAGTPAYMSPEQARGEGHRVDGRSDIFSLGVVMYELLTGRRPFRADSEAELLSSVVAAEPRPLRQYDEKIPKELERICSKAMAKRVRDRYSSAYDMAEELRQFLNEQPMTAATSSGDRSGTVLAASGSTQADTPPAGAVAGAGEVPSSRQSAPGSSRSAWDQSQVKIVPKGLRSFDAHDADFFLELLPGPRDRHGLPDSLRFWKTRLEQRDADDTFPVGLIYGPSGCGKSSLVKAGLLPRLDPNVKTVYVEATALDTETRLLRALRKGCSALDPQLDLKASIARLRRGMSHGTEQKFVILIDQFEQWLHSGGGKEDSQLVQALRQCDGGHVQCVVMVRDDFWMAATRFMQDLEVPLVEGQNSAAVDLFPVRHAKKVLAAFGRAFGSLPPGELSEDQKAFLDQAADGLAVDSLVVCVRLTLFAEMMKDKTWSTATLKEVGGTKGVGATFLEETFSSSTAPPQHRLHQRAARAVLAALLPETGTQIKGNMRSRRHLLVVSGYEDRQRDFSDLIHILDYETRLITPTDPSGEEVGDEADAASGHQGQAERAADEYYYQLTHDYLVPSLRSWLTRKQKESRRGRAELLLQDRASVWNRTRQNRHLPSLVESVKIAGLTDKTKWNQSQQEMMRRSVRVHGWRTGALLLVAVAAVFLAQWAAARSRQQQRIARADGLINVLEKAETSQVPTLIARLQPLRDVADAKLARRVETSAQGTTERLHLALALLPADPQQASYLIGQIPSLTPEQFGMVCSELAPDQSTIDSLWSRAGDEDCPAAERFQIRVALADLASNDPRWPEAAADVSEHLTGADTSIDFRLWASYLRDVSGLLMEPLRAILANESNEFPSSQQARAAVVLSEYLDGQPAELVQTLLLADDYDQFLPLFEALRPNETEARRELLDVLNDAEPSDRTEQEVWNRRSLAAAALVELESADSVWPLLRQTSDTSLRSTIIRALRRFRANPGVIAARLKQETDITVSRALVQCLGGAHHSSLTATARAQIAEQLRALVTSEPDPGLHASAMWALRQWDLPLPALPKGLAEISVERLQKTARWDLEIQQIRRRLDQAGEISQDQRAAWEQGISQQRIAELPGELARIRFDDPGRELACDVSGAVGQQFGQGELKLVPGVVGNAVQLDGQEGIDCGQLVSPRRSDAFSYGCWIRFRKPWGAVMSKMDADESNRGFDMWLQQGKLSAHIAHHEPENYFKVIAVPLLNAGTWYHVLVTYDGSTSPDGIRLFVDGKPIETVTKENSSALRNTIQTDKPFQIGRRFAENDPAKAYPYEGLIDDVRIFDRQLTDAEASAVYRDVIANIAGIPPVERTETQADFLAATHRRLALEQIESELAIAQLARQEVRFEGLPRWYVNNAGQTMMILAQPCRPGGQRFARTFAVAAHEVSVQDFQRFRPEAGYDVTTSPTVNCPMHLVNWWDTGAYCNWLSGQDGIFQDQWCYVPNDEGLRGQGMGLKPDYLQRTGYRLLTEAEWRYACEACTDTMYSAGDSVDVLAQYACFGSNSSGQCFEVGTLLPNDFGLFDMHGNVWEWCADKVQLRGTAAQGRRLLGGGFTSPGSNITRAASSGGPHSYTSNHYGFRVGRTIK